MAKNVKRLGALIGWPSYSLAGLAAASVCWGARLPGGDLPYLAFGLVLGFVVLVAWVVQLVLRLVLAGWHKSSAVARSNDWGAWSVTPLLLGLTVVALALGLPFRVAVFVSQPALDRLAAALLANGVEQHGLWTGVIPISRARRLPDRVEMEFGKSEFPWGRRGLYFSPTGDPVETPEYYDQQSLGSGWYCWHYGGW